MADIAKFIEDIKALSVLELNELVKAIENEFGVSAAAVAVAGPAAGGAAAAPAEEKTEFDVVLKEIGARRRCRTCGKPDAPACAAPAGPRRCLRLRRG